MTDKPDESPDDKEVERRFNETLGRLARSPPKPHDKMKEARGTNPAPK